MAATRLARASPRQGGAGITGEDIPAWAGELFGAFRHVSPDDRDTLRIELISDEALKTSEIEGEILKLDSVQSSLRQQMGLDAETRRVPPEERGIAEMMVDLYRTYAEGSRTKACSTGTRW